jgi:hypothetical protein
LLNKTTALLMPVTPDQNVRFTDPDEKPSPETFATRCETAAPNAEVDVTSVAVMLVAATATSTRRSFSPRLADAARPKDLSCHERRIVMYSLPFYHSLP